MFVNLDGSLTGIVEAFKQKGLRLIPEIWPWTSKRAWQLLGSYAAFEAFLQMYLPGKEFRATTTSNGNVPVYKANGVQSLVVTVVAFFLCWRFDLTSPKEVYDLFGELLAGMAIFSMYVSKFHMPRLSPNARLSITTYCAFPKPRLPVCRLSARNYVIHITKD